MKKEFTPKELEIIWNTTGEKGFLTREEYKKLQSSMNYCYSVFQREMLRCKVPHKMGKLELLLNAFGVTCENKSVCFNEFKTLGEWRKEVFKNSKLNFKITCEICGEKANSRMSHFFNREFFNSYPICSSCINTEVRNLEEVRKRNSEAQLEAQNRPETKEKNRQAQIERFKDPEVRKLYSKNSKEVWRRKGHKEKMSIIALEKWKNPDYARSVIENSKNGGLKGVYKNLYYDSGYELAWLMKMEEEERLDNIDRASFFVSYKDKKGKARSYYPDFLFDKNIVVEVKGYGPWVNVENVELKNRAANKWCRKNGMKFRVVKFRDIGHSWYKRACSYHKQRDKDGKT